MLKQIEKDMMEALKNKNKAKAGALRLLISKCKNKAIEVGHELTDPEVIKVLQSAAKQHKESIRMYKDCLLYTSPSPRDTILSRMPSSA